MTSRPAWQRPPVPMHQLVPVTVERLDDGVRPPTRLPATFSRRHEHPPHLGREHDSGERVLSGMLVETPAMLSVLKRPTCVPSRESWADHLRLCEESSAIRRNCLQMRPCAKRWTQARTKRRARNGPKPQIRFICGLVRRNDRERRTESRRSRTARATLSAPAAGAEPVAPGGVRQREVGGAYAASAIGATSTASTTPRLVCAHGHRRPHPEPHRLHTADPGPLPTVSPPGRHPAVSHAITQP